jgi:hypothetical protein
MHRTQKLRAILKSYSQGKDFPTGLPLVNATRTDTESHEFARDGIGLLDNSEL